MAQDKQQAIYEINRRLAYLICLFRFSPRKGKNNLYENVQHRRDDYASITIYEDTIYDEGTFTHIIRAKASVCQMNPNSDTEELRRAAQQIERAANLVDVINALELQYAEHMDSSGIEDGL